MDYNKPKANDTVARVLGTIGTIGTGIDLLAGRRGIGLFGGRDDEGDRGEHGHRGYPAYQPMPYTAMPYPFGCYEGDRPVNEREAKLRAENAALLDVIAEQKAEKYTDAKTGALNAEICRQQGEIIRLQDEVRCFKETEKRDIHDVYGYCNCTFVPQEKGYVDGRHINYHGVHPRLGVERCDERFCDNRRRNEDRERCDCDE